MNITAVVSPKAALPQEDYDGGTAETRAVREKDSDREDVEATVSIIVSEDCECDDFDADLVIESIINDDVVKYQKRGSIIFDDDNVDDKDNDSDFDKDDDSDSNDGNDDADSKMHHSNDGVV